MAKTRAPAREDDPPHTSRTFIAQEEWLREARHPADAQIRCAADPRAARPFADHACGTDRDAMTDTLKPRLHGFRACLRSDEGFARLFAEFREMRGMP